MGAAILAAKRGAPLDKAAQIIARLALQPHPEGGWYRQTWVGPDREGRASGWRWRGAIRVGQAPVCKRRGPDVLAGEAPQIVVPAGHWQAARSLGAYTLVSCTVSPGFRFAGFELAAPGWSLPDP